MTLPSKVFIESTALFTLGPRVENVDLARLNEMRDWLGFEIIITEVNWQEFLRWRKKEARDCRARLDQIQKNLEKFDLEVNEFDSILGKFQAFSDKIQDYFRAKITALGIQILPLTEIPLPRLLEMAIAGTPPFDPPKERPNDRSSEKGFRDSLVMFTILENLRNRPNDHALVITADDLLRRGFQEHLSEFETTVHFAADFPDALKFMEARLVSSYRMRLQSESGEAKAILLKHRDALEQKIKEVREVKPFGFGLFGTIKEGDQNLFVDSVLSLEFQDIESAIWKERESETSRILFRIKCEATVLVTQPNYALFGFPKYLVGGDTVYSGIASPERREKKTPFWLFGEATLAKKAEELALLDLKIDQTTPEKEDMMELLRLEMPLEPPRTP